MLPIFHSAFRVDSIFHILASDKDEMLPIFQIKTFSADSILRLCGSNQGEMLPIFPQLFEFIRFPHLGFRQGRNAARFPHKTFSADST